MNHVVCVITVLSPLIAAYAINSTIVVNEKLYLDVAFRGKRHRKEVIAIVWIIIYLFIGIFILSLLTSEESQQDKVFYLVILGIILILSYLWDPFYDKLGISNTAILFVLLIGILSTIPLSIKDGWLIIPLVVWISFSSSTKEHVGIDNQ